MHKNIFLILLVSVHILNAGLTVGQQVGVGTAVTATSALKNFGFQNKGKVLTAFWFTPSWETMLKSSRIFDQSRARRTMHATTKPVTTKEFLSDESVYHYQRLALDGNTQVLEAALVELEKNKPHAQSKRGAWKKECAILRCLINDPHIQTLNRIASEIDPKKALDYLNTAKETDLYPYALQCYMDRPKNGLLVAQDPDTILCDQRGQIFMFPDSISASQRAALQPPEMSSKMRNIFCKKLDAVELEHQLSSREKMLTTGKALGGVPLSQYEKLMIKRELDEIKRLRSAPGMKGVEIMRNPSTTLNQLLYQHSLIKNIPQLDPVVKDAAKTAKRSHPEYAAYKKNRALGIQKEATDVTPFGEEQKSIIIQSNVIQKNTPILQHVDLVTTTPTDAVLVQKHIAQSMKNREAQLDQLHSLLTEAAQTGVMTAERCASITQAFLEGAIVDTAEGVVDTALHPVQAAQNIANSAAELADTIGPFLLDIFSYPDSEFPSVEQMHEYKERLQDRAESINKTYAACMKYLAGLSSEQKARLLGNVTGQLLLGKYGPQLAGKGIRDGATLVATALNDTPFLQEMMHQLTQGAQLALPGGEVIALGQETIASADAIKNAAVQLGKVAEHATGIVTAGNVANILKHEAQEVEGAAKEVSKDSVKVYQGSDAILRNGYYEVNGFKFSKIYYERLWNEGRKAPSLVAKEILENTKPIAKDMIKQGFFRYEYGNWEMVYNPASKEVWHLQPIKIK